MARVYAKAARVTLVGLVVTNGAWHAEADMLKGTGGGLRLRGIVTVPTGIQKSSNLGLYLGGHMQS